jgi:hypothetical protein
MSNLFTLIYSRGARSSWNILRGGGRKPWKFANLWSREISSSALGCTTLLHKQSAHVPHNGETTSAIPVDVNCKDCVRYFTPSDSADEEDKALIMQHTTCHVQRTETADILKQVMYALLFGRQIFQSASQYRSVLSHLLLPTAHPTLTMAPMGIPMGTGGKARPGRDADHSPHLMPRLRMSRSYTLSPLPLHRCVLGLHHYKGQLVNAD